MIARALPLLLLLVLLTGCRGNSGSGTEPAITEAASQKLEPSDFALKEVYDRSCRSCHTIAATGAPMTGDPAAWAPRLDKGMNTLVDNVVNGFGGMPPFGMCMDCDGDQFEALIRFMAAGAN